MLGWRRHVGRGVAVGGANTLPEKPGLLPRIAWSPKQIRAAWQDAGTRKILAMMGPGVVGRWRGAVVAHHQHANRVSLDPGQRQLDQLCRPIDGISHCAARRGLGCGFNAAIGCGQGRQ
jgi:hypothetical protein